MKDIVLVNPITKGPTDYKPAAHTPLIFSGHYQNVSMIERRPTMADNIREQLYQCSNCGAEDTVKLYQSERTPPAINCWKCRAGSKMELAHMLQVRTGMFPVVAQ